jgi:hypothetical protein
MESQFQQRAFTKDGEILHVFGLRLFLSDRGILPISRADAVAQGRQYIDDVYAAKKLEVPSSEDESEVRFQGWGGIGIFEHDTAEHKLLFQDLMSTIQRSVKDSCPEKARQLLSDMTSDVGFFYRQVSLSRADASHHVRATVLAQIPVDDFVNAFLALHPSAQRVAMVALKGRYE